MSDKFEMLVDVDVLAGDAQSVSDKVIQTLLLRGLVAEPPNEDCVLASVGYPTGRQIKNAYRRNRNEGAFWESRCSGVEPVIGRGFNEYALAGSGLVCPLCHTKFKPFDDLIGNDFGDEFAKSIGSWLKRVEPQCPKCPKCNGAVALREWGCDPPLGFGNLAFRFWNWPLLESSSWRIDICGLVREVTGHKIVHTHGRI